MVTRYNSSSRQSVPCNTTIQPLELSTEKRLPNGSNLAVERHGKTHELVTTFA
ncbi:Uncharacterised protein [Serratia fonticola]|uniref:Uncharacterized protein n=1 Tax=Serratia fonticola TaxID=47917 RepID=A0A448S2P8_SERFO|nr:Uncharacterised protein [Serratia fonticola]